MTAPVDEARDEYADAMNLELRQSIAARVLEAMDVDQYLIDAVRNAKPPAVKPAIEEPEEFASVVRAGIDGLSDRVLWQRSASGYWFSETSRRAWFSDLHHPEVLRVGLGEVPSESQRAAQDDAYALGAAGMKARARKQFIQLASSAITSERKEAWRQAIEALEALS